MGRYTPSSPIFSTSGLYNGASSVNMAVPHNVGFKPSIVFISIPTVGRLFVIMSTTAEVKRLDTGLAAHAVTPMDATNFYVGNAANFTDSANNNTSNYEWVAYR